MPHFAGSNTQQSPLALIIDDARICRTVLKHQLEQLGCRVLCAVEGEQGFRAAKRWHPSVIFLDMLMPAADGWQVLQQLRQDEHLRDIPVVIVSTLEAESLSALGDTVKYLPKPVTQQALQAILGRAGGTGVA